MQSLVQRASVSKLKGDPLEPSLTAWPIQCMADTLRSRSFVWSTKGGDPLGPAFRAGVRVGVRVELRIPYGIRLYTFYTKY